MATNESVEVISSLALELKYSEEITMFMFTLPVLLGDKAFVLLLIGVYKKRLLLEIYNSSMKLGVTVMLTSCRAVT
jgi:hypothetical protein